MSIMPPLPRLIVGREDVLHHLKARLESASSGQPFPVTIVQGWPGVGKSTTLAALAHDADIQRRFPDGILWTSLGQTPNLLAELVLWGRALGIPESALGGSLEQVTAQVRGALQHRQMLILIDDVWSPVHGAVLQVAGTGCAVFYSTRQNDIAQALAPRPTDIYKLPLLSEAAALDLLQQLAPQVVAAEPASVQELIRDLEGLPLALQVAGRLLSSEYELGFGVDELLADLREGAKLLAAHPPVDVAFATTSPTVAALLNKSIESLTPEMQMRFIYLGMFAPKPATFDLAALAVAWGERDPRPAVRVFINRGLLEPAGNGRFQMHALLVSHARTQAQKAG